MTYSVYVCDCETTSLDSVTGDVIEVCFWRIGEDSSKTWSIKPMNPEGIQDRALYVNKHKREDILHQTPEGREKYRHPDEVLPEIEEWIMQDGCAAEDRVFIGQNPEFDYKFLYELWKKADSAENFPFGFWRNGGDENMGFTLDTIQLARFIDLLLGKKRKFYNLGGLVKSFGIKKAQAHRANGDVQMTKDLYEKIAKVFAQSAPAFRNCYEEKEPELARCVEESPSCSDECNLTDKC